MSSHSLLEIERGEVENEVASPRERATPLRIGRYSGVDIGAKCLGLALFVGGILLLAVSFRLAYDMFTELSSASHVWVQTPPNPKTEPSGVEIGLAILKVFIRILLLFTMGFLASLISSKGTQLYGAAFSSGQTPRPPASSLPEE